MRTVDLYCFGSTLDCRLFVLGCISIVRGKEESRAIRPIKTKSKYAIVRLHMVTTRYLWCGSKSYVILRETTSVWAMLNDNIEGRDLQL